MKRIVQINVESNFGSTGKICENIGNAVLEQEADSYVAHGTISRESTSVSIPVSNKIDQYVHILHTRLFDRHGLSSVKSTKAFLKQLEDLNPDIIHLHNLHGYYINYPLLFEFLKKVNKPVVWTLHDCWAFTGHCTHFEYEGCDKWKTECNRCPLTQNYPKSWLVDRSNRNFNQKKKSFNEIKNLTLVPVSEWLASKLPFSFLKDYPIRTIKNGIDTSVFKPLPVHALKAKKGWENKTIMLGAASVWDTAKGYDDLGKLARLLHPEELMILVGLNKKQIRQLPKNVIGLERTESKDELIQLYNMADVFINLTYADTYPTTNLEALACGTPIITYNTGGSTEEINEYNGNIVSQGDYIAALNMFRKMNGTFKKENTTRIRAYAVSHLDKVLQLKKYKELYQAIV